MRVLIVEDDAELCGVIERALREEGFETFVAHDGKTGEALASEGGYDALVLDWNLPERSGVEIVARMRDADDQTPVLMVTARDELDDRVYGLDAGADDYVVKPFHVEELAARLRSAIRRAGTQRTARYVAGPIEVDVRARRASVDGNEIALTGREFELLEYLVRNAGIALARDRIEEAVWGATFEAASNVLDVFIRRLRRKLGDAEGAVETIRGFGYRLSARSGS
ncbi:MAG TPA: response regulator transcription factor [Candidatus Dormibacteraeota bacterium]|nr:response regulator transcription factor [Candidatus Dormibacteraeota bacterium]